MKKILYITVLSTAFLLSGCENRAEFTPEEKQPVRLDISGSLAASPVSKGDGMINPIDLTGDKGLPPKQLIIGLVTNEFGTDGTIPAVADWSESYVTELDRGFFGGNVFGDGPTTPGITWNGNIEYTSFGGGTAIQNVFYPENHTYYFFVACYPYPDDIDTAPTETDGTGTTVYFTVDGSQDVMASTMGGGNIDKQYGAKDSQTDEYLTPYGAPLVFYHKLTALRCKFIAESSVAEQLYGSITNIELVGQPDVVGLNIGEQALAPTTTPLSDERTTAAGTAYSAYVTYASNSMPLPVSAGAYDPNDATEFGYILAMPLQGTYTFRITTTTRFGINTVNDIDYTFPDNGTPVAGTAYNLTFKMLETAEINVSATEAVDWWLDQTFD